MASYQQVTSLRVLAWGEQVGAIAPSGRPGQYAFEYDDRWRRRGLELAPALMPAQTPRRRVWVFPGLNPATFHGLPPMLADSVPDRFGNAVINAALAREGVSPEDVSALDRLAYIGRRGMGALTFEPDQGGLSEPPTSIVLADLVEAARSALRGDLGEAERTHALNDLLSVGSSAGGARAKAVIAWNRETDEIRAGNVAVPSGFEQWLLKFDGVENKDKGATFGATNQWGRIEYAYSLMAAAAGINMPETHLLEEDGRAHFMIRRFDRPGTDGERLHMQTLCAMDALDFNQVATHDYASLMLRLHALGGNDADRQEVFRRAVFNVLASNNDDHTKNHSFLMDSSGNWTLSPAYDVVYAFDPGNKWLRRHQMSIEGEFGEITQRHLLTFGDRFDVPDIRGVIDQVGEAIASWNRYAGEAGVSSDRADRIGTRLRALAIKSA
jgi:serine/threonine-protein kinase HipA